jgi:hypothetical protein
MMPAAILQRLSLQYLPFSKLEHRLLRLFFKSSCYSCRRYYNNVFVFRKDLSKTIGIFNNFFFPYRRLVTHAEIGYGTTSMGFELEIEKYDSR